MYGVWFRNVMHRGNVVLCRKSPPPSSSLLTYSQGSTKLGEFFQEIYNIVPYAFNKSFDLDAENVIMVGKEFAPMHGKQLGIN